MNAEREWQAAGYSVGFPEDMPNWEPHIEAEKPMVYPCRTIVVTDAMRAEDARLQAEREASHRAAITWISPVRQQEENRHHASYILPAILRKTRRAA